MTKRADTHTLFSGHVHSMMLKYSTHSTCRKSDCLAGIHQHGGSCVWRMAKVVSKRAQVEVLRASMDYVLSSEEEVAEIARAASL